MLAGRNLTHQLGGKGVTVPERKRNAMINFETVASPQGAQIYINVVTQLPWFSFQNSRQLSF